MLLDLAMSRASLCLPAPHQPSAGAQENQRAEPGSASGHEGLYPALYLRQRRGLALLLAVLSW